MEPLKALLRPLLGPLVRRIRLRRRARALVAAAAGLTDHGALFDAVMATPDFAPLQKRSEFTALMARVAELAPAVVVEIGSFAGGTGFLLARVARADAVLVLVDDQFDDARRAALAGFARGRQRIATLHGDSHAAAMRDRVAAATGGQPVDLLFIDGDHRYEGVARDYALYAPLVRDGGLIAFHDIVQDRRTLTGESSTADAGGVPRFWRELRDVAQDRATEFVENPLQDACGIGVLYWRP